MIFMDNVSLEQNPKKCAKAHKPEGAILRKEIRTMDLSKFLKVIIGDGSFITAAAILISDNASKKDVVEHNLAIL